MRDNKLWLLVVLALATMMSHPAWAGTSLWNFDDAAQTDEWEVANGDWSVKGGVYQETSGGQVAMHSLVGDENWEDYVVQAKIRMDVGNWGGLIFRAQSELEYYVYYLNVPDNKSELWRHEDGAFDTRTAITSNIPAAGKLKIANGEFFDVKVVVEGDVFQLFINDELQSEQQDGTYDTGKIGVWAWQTQASFDDVTVTGDDVEDNAVFAVQARGKLTTTWGKLKKAR